MLKYRDLDDIEGVVDLCQHHGSKMCVCVCVCVYTLRMLFARVHAGARLLARCGETLAVVGVC